MPELVLFGRSKERTRIDVLLREADQGRSGTLLLRGQPGAGKSALCAFAMAHCAGMTVLSTRGVEAEAKLPFAGLSDLLRPLLDRLDAIPPSQALALCGALALTPADAVEPFAVNAATLSLLAAAAEQVPVLLVVDDAHWVDVPSIEAITFVARRIEADRIAMLLTVREGGRRTALDDSDIPELSIGALDASASRKLLRSLHPEIAEHVATTLIRETAGNPLALVEVTRVLDASQRTGREPLPDPLPVAPRLERLFRETVDALPEATKDALVVAAACETRSLTTVVPAIEASHRRAADLEPAERAKLVRINETDLEFRHPVLRSAIYHGAPAELRRAAHRAVAQVVTGDRRAWHLAASTIGPDESVAHALELAARNARRVGGFATAAATFEKAAAHSESPESRARRLFEAATDNEIAGRLNPAAADLDAALKLVADPLLRADIQWARGRIDMWSGNVREAHALLVHEAHRVARRDSVRAALMYAEAVMACYMSGHIERAVVTARRAYELALPLGGHPATMGTLVLGHSLVLAGDARDGYPLLLQALQLFDDAVPLSLQQWFGYAGQCLTWMEDFTRARTLFDRMIASAREHNTPARLAYALMIRAELDLRTGKWTRALADAAESVRLANELGQAGLIGAASASLSLIAAATGREDDARAHAARTADIGERFGFASFEVYSKAALGNLDLSLGRPQQAVRHLEPLVAVVGALGLGEPATVMWTPDLIEAYIRAGRHDDAHRVLAMFERQALNAQRPWALAAAARCAGMLADPRSCSTDFDEALRHHDQVSMPFERARTQLCYGEQLRRANRRVAARSELRDALAVFDALRTEAWAGRAREELRATGARTPRRGGADDARPLTPQEMQVALAVGQGLSNKEVAAKLFLSPKTVEFHLSNVYRKLGLNSRTQLANYLSRTTLRPMSSPSGSC